MYRITDYRGIQRSTGIRKSTSVDLRSFSLYAYILNIGCTSTRSTKYMHTSADPTSSTLFLVSLATRHLPPPRAVEPNRCRCRCCIRFTAHRSQLYGHPHCGTLLSYKESRSDLKSFLYRALHPPLFNLTSRCLPNTQKHSTESAPNL